MSELRWVLLALGIVVVAGVYIWSRGYLRRRASTRGVARRRRAEPRIDDTDEPPDPDILFRPAGEVDGIDPARRIEPQFDGLTADPAAGTPVRDSFDASEHADVDTGAEGDGAEHDPAPRRPAGAIDKVVTLRFVAREGELDAEATVSAMLNAGLEHGRYGIFHLPDDRYPDEARFSVASLTEPGSFDLDRLHQAPLAGMTFFMVLPGLGDPVDRFDTMVGMARALAHTLDAELFDDGGSSWSIQRERYLREELIRYRLQHFLA